MSGLPKKYAKMGFKKGWKEYKASKCTSRGRTVAPVRRATNMARRRRSYPRARRSVSRARGFGGGGIIGNVLDGVIVGAVQGMIPNDALFGYGDSLVPIGVGWFRKNKTLQTIGGYQLGLKVAQGFAGQGSTPGFRGQ